MDIILRKATLNDIPSLIRLRIDFLSDGRKLIQEEESEIRAQLEKYFPKHIAENTFVGIFAEADEQIVATVYLAISERPANPLFITGKIGTVLNVYTYPKYRGRGIATKVIRAIIEEAKHLGVSHIELLSVNEVKNLYEKTGFKVSEEFTAMGLKL